MMDKILWCASKKGGLSLIEPNLDLANAYIIKAEEALESMRVNIIKDWKISTAYYTIYFSLYALMMKIGVKCEIHSCTIEFTKRYFNDYFDESEFKFIEDSCTARVDSQYYIDRTVPDEQYNLMIQKTPEFLVKCKSILIKLNDMKVNEIRDKYNSELHNMK